MSISMQYAAPEAPQPERTAGAIAGLGLGVREDRQQRNGVVGGR